MRRRVGIGGLILLTVFAASCRDATTQPERTVTTSAAALPVWALRGDEAPPEGERRPSGAMKALRYWSAQRAYPAKTIPDRGFGRALETSRSMRETYSGGGLDGGVTPWSSIGPANVGGRTLTLAVHPDDPDLLFAGSASGGLWKSTTGGVGASAWSRVDLGVPGLGVSTIAIDPGDTDVMYIGTGEAYAYQISDGGEVDRTTRGSYGVGILKSVDGGASWSSSLDWSYEQSRGVWMIRIHPTNPAILYAATTEGIYQSIDAGTSWNLVHPVIMATDVRIHPTIPDIALSAHGNFSSTGHGIYRTIDGGQSWTKLTGGLPATWSGKAQLAISSSTPVRIYASIANTFNGLGLYRSGDNGLSWTLVNGTNYPQFQGWYSHYVVLSPFSPGTLFTGGIEIWRSFNGGGALEERSNWQSIFVGVPSPPEGPIGAPDYAHADHHFAIWHPTDPDTVFFASDGGVFKTSDLGDTFESLIGGYQTSQFYNGFAQSATDPALALGGLQDNFSVIYEGTDAWIRVIGGDGNWGAINPVDDTTMYASAQFLQNFRSQDSGDNWTAIFPPNAADDVTAFIAPQVLATTDPSRLYAGRSRVYRSDDEGTSWTATNGGSQLSPGDPVVSMAVAGTDADVVYAGTAPLTGPARVFVTQNGGVFWQDVSAALPDRYPSDIAVDPQDPDRAVVTLMGFGSSHVFETIDGGDSWTDIGQGLPDIPTSAVTIDPEYPEAIYVGTDLGIFVSLDGGSSWQPFDDGISTAMVNDLKVFQPTRTMRVATHGNGAWEREMLGPGNCPVPGEAAGLQLEQVGGSTVLSWAPPLDPGVATLRYDTLSSATASDFSSDPSATCVESNDGNDNTATDATPVAPGEVLYYVVRARSLCGPGSAGSDSQGAPRAALDCPFGD